MCLSFDPPVVSTKYIVARRRAQSLCPVVSTFVVRSRHRVPMETADRVHALYQQRYPDFDVRHFHEKFREVEGIR